MSAGRACPAAKGSRRYVKVDGSLHCNTRSTGRLRAIPGRDSTPRLVHLPVQASWLNQCDEVHFSVSQRKIPTPNNFGSLAEAEAGLLAVQESYQQIAVPFEWKFTKSNLTLLLKRLAANEPAPALPA